MSSMHEEEDYSVLKLIKHVVSTPPTVSDSTNARPLCHEGRKNSSEAWNHFIQLKPKLDKRA